MPCPENNHLTSKDGGATFKQYRDALMIQNDFFAPCIFHLLSLLSRLQCYPNPRVPWNASFLLRRRRLSCPVCGNVFLQSYKGAKGPVFCLFCNSVPLRGGGLGFTSYMPRSYIFFCLDTHACARNSAILLPVQAGFSTPLERRGGQTRITVSPAAPLLLLLLLQ